MNKKITLPTHIASTVARAIEEDLGSGDLTAQLTPENHLVTAQVISREAGVLCGQDWFDEVFHQLDQHTIVGWLVQDGDTIKPNQVLCRIQGHARSILSGERTALNFLQTLSGTATLTRQFTQALKDLPTQILDSRKTIPGLRLAQKYAVSCGGGKNHRLGLYDAILIKENHISACGSITAAITQAKILNDQVTIEVEVETLAEFSEALTAQPDIIMLDNFSIDDLQQAVALNQASKHPVKLEASGNVSLETVVTLAETGVDYISSGSLTKNMQALDLSMRFIDQN